MCRFFSRLFKKKQPVIVPVGGRTEPEPTPDPVAPTPQPKPIPVKPRPSVATAMSNGNGSHLPRRQSPKPTPSDAEPGLPQPLPTKPHPQHVEPLAANDPPKPHAGAESPPTRPNPESTVSDSPPRPPRGSSGGPAHPDQSAAPKGKEPKPYATISEYTTDELSRADYLLRAFVIAHLRPGHAAPPDEMLARTPGRLAAHPDWLSKEERGKRDACVTAARAYRDDIDRRLAVSPDAVRLAVHRLRDSFTLREPERDALFLSLLAQVTPVAARWFAQLQYDDRRTDPSTGLVVEILAPVSTSVLVPAELFSPVRPWVHLGIVRVGNPATPSEPLAARSVRVADRVAAFLFDDTGIDLDLAPFATLPLTDINWDHLLLADHLVKQLKQLAERKLPRLTLVFHGPYGAGQVQAARAYCHETKLPLLAVDVPAALRHPGDWPRVVAAAYREAGLRGAAVLWRGAGPLLEKAQIDKELVPTGGWDLLTRHAANYAGVTFLETATSPPPPRGLSDASHPYAQFDFHAPPFALRRRIWEVQFDVTTATPSNFFKSLAERLANSFQLTQGQVADAADTARGILLTRTMPAGKGQSEDQQRAAIVTEAYTEACRIQSARQLVAFARRIPPHPGADWTSLVVPFQVQRQLEELEFRGRKQAEVYERFGFDKRLRLGKGLVALFVGSSGTGKTMAAGILAGKRGVDLYKVDLSAVVSKYVGETERHLAQVFADAEAANAFLFFDEADALFGKRGEVKDARDRWANMEVDFLLQRVEEFSGTVVLATNLRQNIDEAFLRRIHAVVEFPFPGAEDRYKILRGLLPAFPSLPQGASEQERGCWEKEYDVWDTDLWEVANRFALSGGSLKNVAIDAVFRQVRVNAPHVVGRNLADAVAREYQKLGKPVTKGDFGERFYKFVSDDLLSPTPPQQSKPARAG